MAYLAQSLARLRSQTNSTFPSRSTASDGWIGDEAHQAGVSDHNPDAKTGVVRALDLTANATQAKRIKDACVGDSRVNYVIHNRQIWTRSAKRWEKYSGSNPHTKHVHISLLHTKAAEDGNSDWKGLDMAGMCSPVEGSISSHFGMRGGLLHAGIDIATGGVSRVVYAAYAGTLSNIVRGRVHDRSAAQTKNKGKAVVVPGRTGNGGRVNNPDGETQAYIHVALDSKWKNGMKVKKGERLGVVDLSGNTSGYHLHFEVWNRNGQVRNPMIDFTFHGVRPGEKPRSIATAPSAPKAPAAPKAPKGPSAKVKGYLSAMGFPQNVDGVKRYQREHGLVADGDWGPITDGYYQWVKSLQRALNQWKAVQPKLRVDGHRGSLTKNAEVKVQHPPLNRQILGTTKASLFKGLGIAPEPRKRA